MAEHRACRGIASEDPAVERRQEHGDPMVCAPSPPLVTSRRRRRAITIVSADVEPTDRPSWPSRHESLVPSGTRTPAPAPEQPNTEPRPRPSNTAWLTLVIECRRERDCSLPRESASDYGVVMLTVFDHADCVVSLKPRTL
jgi:hypothetical protein